MNMFVFGILQIASGCIATNCNPLVTGQEPLTIGAPVCRLVVHRGGAAVQVSQGPTAGNLPEADGIRWLQPKTTSAFSVPLSTTGSCHHASVQVSIQDLRNRIYHRGNLGCGCGKEQRMTLQYFS